MRFLELLGSLGWNRLCRLTRGYRFVTITTISPVRHWWRDPHHRVRQWWWWWSKICLDTFARIFFRNPKRLGGRIFRFCLRGKYNRFHRNRTKFSGRFSETHHHPRVTTTTFCSSHPPSPPRPSPPAVPGHVCVARRGGIVSRRGSARGGVGVLRAAGFCARRGRGTVLRRVLRAAGF